MTDIAYFKNNIILFKIKNLFGDGSKKFDSNAWIYFITSLLYGAAVNVVPNGYVTPKSICESLIPEAGQKWNIPVEPINGKYEWPNSTTDWQNLFIKWANLPSDIRQLPESHYKPDLDAWENEKNNFLKPWGLKPSSPLLMGFITGWRTYKNDILYPTAMNPLLGMKSGILGGGWWGFLNSGSQFSDMGLDEINSIIWASEVPVEIANANYSSKCNVANIAQGAIGTGMGGGFIGAAIGARYAATAAVAAEGAAEGSAAGPVGAFVGVIIGAIIGGVMSASATKCI